LGKTGFAGSLHPSWLTHAGVAGGCLCSHGDELVDALIKNVYGGDAANKPYAVLLARYLRR
jgi:hypothetical protein